MPSVSKTSIANLALSHLRQGVVLENVDTETSTQAVQSRLWYDPARRQALVDYDPGFARKRLTLASHNVDPSADWTYRYQWPADCLQPRFIQNAVSGNLVFESDEVRVVRGGPPVPFTTEVASDDTRSIMTDMDEATLVYTRDVDSATFFTPHFVLALSYLLAHYVAGPLTHKRSIQDGLLEKYLYTVDTGMATQNNVEAPATEGAPQAPWIRNR